MSETAGMILLGIVFIGVSVAVNVLMPWQHMLAFWGGFWFLGGMGALAQVP